jgi:hypothetical protein
VDRNLRGDATIKLVQFNTERISIMEDFYADDRQAMLPLDERFRQAEQYSLDLQPPASTRPATQSKKLCPVHGSIEIHDCPYCQTRYL